MLPRMGRKMSKPVYLSPSEVKHWKIGDYYHRWSIRQFFKDIYWGLGNSMPLCCVLYYSIEIFITGKPQARRRGIVKTRNGDRLYIYVPCPKCLRRFKNA